MTVARNPALAPASAARAPAAASPSTPMIVLGLGLLLALVLLRLESPIPEAVRFRAGVLWMLYLLPTALYASRPRSQQRPLPTVAILGIVHATYYALPPLAGIVNAAYRPDGSSLVPYVDPVHDLPAAIDVALWGWVMFLVGYTVATLLLPDRRGVKHPLRVVPLVRALWIVAAAGLAIESLGALANVPIMFAGTAGFVA
ncbi:MAG TPA: hypothetical protein VHM30_11615, partial [Gemmatimonadaceae bacterium]|nr:hypothetical protein [Gemmatimonadaceae bacterium]